MLWLIGLILIWFRPSYIYMAYWAALMITISGLLALLNPQTAMLLAIDAAISGSLFAALGAAVVALRKWMTTRKTGGDKKLDAEMDAIRAEIAARDSAPPTTPG